MDKKKFIKNSIVILLAPLLIFILINLLVFNISKDIIHPNSKKVPSQQTLLILGARVYKSGKMSDMLKDRVDTAIELYQGKKAQKILVSGDHGRNEYDEVNTIKEYLLKNNIPEKDIFLDHAGFDTYDSIYRAKEIFQVKSLIIITQKFHLPRALFIARKLKIEAQGVIADKHIYYGIRKSQLRESLANIKATLNIIFRSEPKFLGDKIPITGNSKLSWD